MADPKIKRALMSVTDKTGIVDFARALHEEFGVEIVSTGGTAKVIEEAGVPVRPIDDLTGFPEMMDGRVKTLLEPVAFAKKKVINIQSTFMKGFKVPLAFGNNYICLFNAFSCLF